MLEDANRILQCESVEGTGTEWEFCIDPDTQRPCRTKAQKEKYNLQQKKGEN